MPDENEPIEGEDGAKPEDTLGDAGKRALDAERKARKAAEKRAAEAEAKVKESEDAEKTEVERLQGQVTDLTKKLEGESARADRYEVAAAKGLSLAQARRLVGESKEELEADADEMRTELGLDQDDKGQAIKARPKENLKLGASNEDEDDEADPAEIAEKVLNSGW